jgi:DnaK suppressor protein
LSAVIPPRPHERARNTEPWKECDVTSTVHDPTELLRNTLEEQFRRHTDQLTELTVCSQQPDCGGYDRDTLAALIASARGAVADTARALRRMAEGSYGVCERCTAAIPLQRLEIMPHARFCVTCQRAPSTAEFTGPATSTHSGPMWTEGSHSANAHGGRRPSHRP